MTTNSRSLCAFAFAAFATAGVAGCFCPPCPAGCAAGPASAAAAAGPSATAEAPAAGPVATGNRLVIWDGDGAGAGAQEWNSCDQKPCAAKVSVEPGVGANGSTGLKFHGEGGGWIGMGWNLFGWYPENAGIDLTPYTHLTFQIRVDAKGDPGSPSVALGCSSNKANSADAPIEKFEKTFRDGKWHKVSIPISALKRGAGAKFDAASFWEFRISTWASAPRNFDFYIDEIAAEKQ